MVKAPFTEFGLDRSGRTSGVTRVVVSRSEMAFDDIRRS